jgi:hypothetical protein
VGWMRDLTRLALHSDFAIVEVAGVVVVGADPDCLFGVTSWSIELMHYPARTLPAPARP